MEVVYVLDNMDRQIVKGLLHEVVVFHVKILEDLYRLGCLLLVLWALLENILKSILYIFQHKPTHVTYQSRNFTCSFL